MAYRREIVVAQILLDKHSVHRGRCTEGGYTVLCEHGKYLRRIESVEVIGEYSALAEPLTVELAPQSLAPSGLGNREVKSVLLATVPIFRGHVMTECVLVGMHSHLGIAGRARGKEHEHRIVSTGSIGLAQISAAEETVLAIIKVPSFPLAADYDLGERKTVLLLCELDLTCGITVCGTEYRADTRRLEAIGEIVLDELICRGDRDRAELMKSEYREPELIMSLENEHNSVAALDAEGFEVVCTLRGGILYILEGESALGHIVCHVEHRELVGILTRYLVDGIKREIISILIGEAHVKKLSVLVLYRLYKFFAKKRLCLLCIYRLTNVHRLIGAVARHNHSKKYAILTVNCYHTVRSRGLEEDAVALAKRFLVLTDSDAHCTLHDHIKLLTRVSNRADGTALKLLGVLIGYPIGCCKLMSEKRSHILNGDAVLTRGSETCASAGNGISRELCTVTLENIRDLHAKHLGTLVHEGKGQIDLTRLVRKIHLLGNIYHLRHLLSAVSKNLTHLANSERDPLQLADVVLVGHDIFLLFDQYEIGHKKQKTPQEKTS